jgi:proton-dependent oligopeptide transporter, POT family
VDTAPVASAIATGRADPAERQLFGQPRGLYTLFFTEMWERFTYYGLSAMLVLFMVDAATRGGLGIDDRTASAIYGLYLAIGYLLAVLGGYISDRLIGPQRAVLAGAVLIMAGDALLISGTPQIFFLGLLTAAFGVGLLKPNISAIVAQLYPEGGSRRDAGFSIFYMGINLGSFFGSTLVPLCAARYGWHAGFALLAAGMTLGLVQFLWTRGSLGQRGLHLAADAHPGSWWPVVLLVSAVLALVALQMLGSVSLNPNVLAVVVSWMITILAIAYFAWLLLFAGLSSQERSRVYVMMALFAGCAVFWAGFFQMGTSFNLFAARYTDRIIFGHEIPAGVLQGVNPLFIIIFAPLLAGVWLALGRRDRDLSAPAKFGAGLILMGAGFFVMYIAAQYVLRGEQVLPTWLIATYLCHTLGELCLSPVGLSSMSKLAPARFVGQVMGLWFMAMALGTNLAGQFAGDYDASQLASLPALFLKIFWWGAVSGVIMLLMTPFLKRLMPGVR